MEGHRINFPKKYKQQFLRDFKNLGLLCLLAVIPAEAGIQVKFR